MPDEKSDFEIGGEAVTADISYEQMVTVIRTQEAKKRGSLADMDLDATADAEEEAEPEAEPEEEPSLFGMPSGIPKVPGMPEMPEMPSMPSFGGFMPDLGDLGGGMGASMTAMSVLDSDVKVKMNPLQMKKAGTVIQNMQGAGYSDEQINHFLDQTEEDMKLAWKVFDKDDIGYLNSEEFKKTLPLMGENVSDEKVEELFQLVDENHSGKIEFSEFTDLLKGMNPQTAAEGESAFGGMGSGLGAIGNLGGGMGASFKAMSVLHNSTKVKMNPLQMKKAGVVIQNMQGAGYSDEHINDVCRALFLDQNDNDMKLAWKVFDRKNVGFLEGKDFRKTLPLLGEDISEAKVDELFRVVDEDGSGKIEFPEFVRLLQGMNPKEGEEGDSAFGGFSSGLGSIGGGLTSMAGGMGGGMAATMKAMSVLDTSIKTQMNPMQMKKAGVVIKNMQGAGYNDEQINDVCRALFLTQCEDDMKKAWLVFDVGGMGELDADEFREALPLFGEDVPQSEIDELFKAADNDGSGRIEFDEFQTLMKGMNPKQ